jgi:hypothetical protein
MRCEEYRALHLAGESSEAMAAHVNGCAACRAEAEMIDRQRAQLADPALWEEPSSSLEDVVVGLVRGPSRMTATTPWYRRWPSVAAGVALVVAVGLLLSLLRHQSPDWEVAMPGTLAAPEAWGTVQGWNTDAGTRLVVEVSGLDPAPEGYVYEFWMSKGPVHISAGTFTNGDNVELWTGVRRADFPRLWVTLEPIDADESLSGVTVLDTGV